MTTKNIVLKDSTGNEKHPKTNTGQILDKNARKLSNILDIINSNLSRIVSTIYNMSDYNYTDIDTATWESGYINKEDNVVDSNYAKHSDYLLLDHSKLYKINTAATSAWFIASFYDANKKMVYNINSDNISYKSESGNFSYTIYEHLYRTDIVYARFTIARDGGRASVANSEFMPVNILGIPFRGILNDNINKPNGIYFDTSSGFKGVFSPNCKFIHEIHDGEEKIIPLSDSRSQNGVNNIIAETVLNDIIDITSYVKWTANKYFDHEAVMKNSEFAKVSDYIELPLLNSNTVICVSGQISYLWHCVYYNSDKQIVKIENLYNYTRDSCHAYLNFVIRPADAKYIRLSMPNAGKVYLCSFNNLNAKIDKVQNQLKCHSDFFDITRKIQFEDKKRIQTDGTIVPSDYNKISNYIYCKNRYIQVYSLFNSNSYCNLYDDNKRLLKTINYCNIVASQYAYFDILADNASYIRITISNTTESAILAAEKSRNKLNIDNSELMDLLSEDNYADIISPTWEDGYLKNNVLKSSTVSRTSRYVKVYLKKIRLKGAFSNAWDIISFYDAAKNFIYAIDLNRFSNGEATYNISSYITICDAILNTDIYYARFVSSKNDSTYNTQLCDFVVRKKTNKSSEINKVEHFAGITDIGFLDNLAISNEGICYIPMYGQSYTQANDGAYKLTDKFEDNLYMHGESCMDAGDITLRKLTTAINTEYIISDFGNAFARLLKRYFNLSPDILLQSYGEGSRSVLELQQNNGYDSPAHHTFENKLIPGVTNAVSAATNAGKDIYCPFIIYLQGESDIVTADRETGATPDSACKGDKDRYKQEFLKLKLQMQDLITSKLNQTKKPIVFVYNPGNATFREANSGISQAITELCEENDDVFSMGPYYNMPSMGAHPSPDGRRWLAQKLAGYIINVQQRGIDPCMRVKRCSINGNTLTLSIKTPQTPLTVDTYTVPEQHNFGFLLGKKDYGDKGNMTEFIKFKIKVNSDTIDFITDEDLLSIVDRLYLTYGATGLGNVRDSYNFKSSELYASNENGNGKIVYIPTKEDGNSLIGESYPLNNWLPAFGIWIKDYMA